MDNKDLKLSKKLISSYKERLENEILKRSHKLRIPIKISQEIINNNHEIKELNIALKILGKKNSSNQKI